MTTSDMRFCVSEGSPSMLTIWRRRDGSGRADNVLLPLHCSCMSQSCISLTEAVPSGPLRKYEGADGRATR